MFQEREYALRHYSYRCTCGFELTVSVDCGTPQGQYTCRSCGSIVMRREK